MFVSSVTTGAATQLLSPQEKTNRFSAELPSVASRIQSMNLKPPVLFGLGLLALASLSLAQAGAKEFGECFKNCMGNDAGFWRGVGCTAACGALLLV